ncbi:MAG: hypothetical protein ACRYFX_13960 [Janthinobacterium lividum]
MADQDNTILVELQLNSAQFKQEQTRARQALAELVLSMEATKKKTAELEAARKAGTVADTEYSRQSVELREELNKQRAEQRELEKGLQASQKAHSAAAGSVEQLRGALAQLGAQQQQGAEASQQQAASTQAAAGSIAALRQQLAGLEAKRETLAPLSKEAEELSAEILETKSQLQQSLGVIDEWGERVQKNIRRENFDTVSDAVNGLVSATAAANIIFGDNADAAKAQAKALQLMALSQEARNIAIGIGSAREAVSIVLTKAKNVLLREAATVTAAAAISTEAHAAVAGADAAAIEAQAGAAALNAEGQAASTAATVGNTVATEAQAAATGKASIFQALLNRVMLLSPIGWLVLAVTALVGVFLAYAGASDKTKQRVQDFAKALLLFTNPIGLAIVGINALYNRFEAVRSILDPLIAGFKQVGAAIGEKAQALGEYIGLLDNAAQRAAKLSQQELAQAEKQIALYDAQAKAQELAGQRIENVRATQRKGLELAVEAQRKANATQATLDAEALAGIAKKQAAKVALSDKEQELLNKSVENATKLKTTENNLNSFILEGIERVRAARAQAAADMETNAQRSADASRRQIEESIADRKAALQSKLSYLDRELAAVRINSEEEVELQRQRLATQRDLALLNLGPTLAQERALRAQNLGRILADQKASEKLALAANNLTEEQKQHIQTEFANKAADTRRAFSTEQAQREVSARQNIVKDANAALTTLNTNHVRQVSLDSLQAEQERNTASLAANKQAQAERTAQALEATQQQLEEEYQMQSRAAELERELALASLDTRKDNAAAELRIRAETNRKLAELNAGQADAARQRRARELSEEAQHYTLLADAMLAGLNQGEQQQAQASEAYKQQRIAALLDEQDAKLAVVAASSQQEANILLDTENKLKQIRQDSAQAQLDLLKAQTEKVASVITGSLNSLAAIQDADSQAKLARIDAEMNQAGVSAARHEVLEKQKLRVEKQAAEQRKRIARAQAVVQLGTAILQILSEPSVLPSPLAEIVKAAEIAAATVTAYAQFKAIDSAKFARGGVLSGPSHANGGIPLFHRRTGQPLGAEAEGDEIILTKGVYRHPTLRALASALNVAGGGNPLVKAMDIPAKYMEGGVVSSSAEILPQILTGGVVVHTPPIDYNRLAAATPPIDYELLGEAVARHVGPKFESAARALPQQKIVTTELRDELRKLDKRDSETNI